MSRPRIVPAWLGAVVSLVLVAPVMAQDMGTVLKEQKIASGTGGFTGTLDSADHFGRALAALEDLDGDGVSDLLAGVPDDDDGGVAKGGVWVLFLRPDGTVRSQAKVSNTQGGFTGRLDTADRFGSAVADLGDLDGDGFREIAVGAEQDDDGGANRGAVWILSLAANGSVSTWGKISQTSSGFAGALRDGDRFGCSLAALGDLDGDGNADLAVGASTAGDGGLSRGAVWVLYLDAQGAVARHAKISSTSGGFAGPLRDGDRFGSSLAVPGDLDHDGTFELVVGAMQDDDGGTNSGAAWVLFLRPDGSVRTQSKLSWSSGLAIDDSDQFGCSVAAPGDLDGDGTADLAVGAHLDDDGGSLNRGAVWMLFLEADGGLKAAQKISDVSGGLTATLTTNSFFGNSLAALGDLDGDRKMDMAVGAEGDDTGGTDRGAVHILFLESAVKPVLVVRNGLGVNPVLLTAEDAPELGELWEVHVDCRGFNNGVVIHMVVDTPSEGPMRGGLGQCLIDWNQPRILRVVARHLGVETRIYHAVPADPALAGLKFYSQAHVTGRGGAKLTNALDGEFTGQAGPGQASLTRPAWH